MGINNEWIEHLAKSTPGWEDEVKVDLSGPIPTIAAAVSLLQAAHSWYLERAGKDAEVVTKIETAFQTADDAHWWLIDAEGN